MCVCACIYYFHGAMFLAEEIAKCTLGVSLIIEIFSISLNLFFLLILNVLNV